MTRDLLRSILEKAPGVSSKEGAYRVEPEHRAALYLVAHGQTNLLHDVVAIRLEAEIATVECRDGAQHFLALAMIQGLTVRPPGRTGF